MRADMPTGKKVMRSATCRSILGTSFHFNIKSLSSYWGRASIEKRLRSNLLVGEGASINLRTVNSLGAAVVLRITEWELFCSIYNSDELFPCLHRKRVTGSFLASCHVRVTWESRGSNGARSLVESNTWYSSSIWSSYRPNYTTI